MLCQGDTRVPSYQAESANKLEMGQYVTPVIALAPGGYDGLVPAVWRISSGTLNLSICDIQ